jgi:hypothetical protein
MNLATRRLIFIVFVGLFIVLVPAIILYAWGINFNLNKGNFFDTGGIYLKSVPAKADIYIDGTLKGKTNDFVRGLRPKIYDVKIIKDEYYAWQKNLIVEPSLVTKANSIFLIPLNPKILMVADISEAYRSFFKEPYSLTALTQTIKEKSKYTISKIENISKDKNSQKIYFLANNNLYYIDWNENKPTQSTLSKVLASGVLNYAVYKNGIMYAEKTTGKIYELDLTSLKSAEFFEQVYPSLNQCKWTFSPDYKKLLCQKDKSVEILYLDETDNGCDFKKGSLDKMDFEQKILDVVWHSETEQHLILATEDSILITELDNREPRNSIKFITTENPQIKYDENNGILYFSSGKLLYMTEI